MAARLTVLYAILFGSILLGCRTQKTCLQQCIDAQSRYPNSDIIVYRRGDKLHSVLSLYYDPAFGVMRPQLDGKYLYVWRAK